MFLKKMIWTMSFVAGAAVCAPAAMADDFPTKPITWVSPWNPGGANDTLSRAIAQEAEKVLGQPIAVINRPGASGTIGSASVATANDNGYSVVLGSTPTHATAPHIYANLPYDPEKDFSPVTMVGSVPNVLVVNPKLDINSVDELIAYAKAHPGELNYYSTGPGTSQHLSAALFENLTGVKMEHVPYTGSAPAMVDLLAGRIDLAFDNMNTVIPHIEAGSLRALGVTTPERSDALPDVPTIAEAGVDGYDASVWFGVFAAPGTAPERLDILQNAIATALQTPALAERLNTLGVRVIANTPAEFSKIQASEITRWGEVAKAAGIELR
ncbi:MAG: tripartite tricarboxylate transporter substrate binding protein [Rhizobiaceae bacterium]|nr:tripartite tricarboxylate transporter substrate binding protein [Rhizobiaceae bacterium]